MYINISDAKIVHKTEKAVQLEFPTGYPPFVLWTSKSNIREIEGQLFLAYSVYLQNKIWSKYGM